MVANALQDKKKYTVVQVAPAVRTTLGEEYNLPLGQMYLGSLLQR
jgi:iron only hydrogenase large subunit-like protein